MANQSLGDMSGGGTYVEGGEWPPARDLLALIVLFFFVISDIFRDSLTGRIPGATEGREPTTLGLLLQAAMLALLFGLYKKYAGASE